MLVFLLYFSFFYESERGLFPDTEFVFDLELPPDFVPRNQDNEVEKFELVTASVSIYFIYILLYIIYYSTLMKSNHLGNCEQNFISRLQDY